MGCGMAVAFVILWGIGAFAGWSSEAMIVVLLVLILACQNRGGNGGN